LIQIIILTGTGKAKARNLGKQNPFPQKSLESPKKKQKPFIKKVRAFVKIFL
jgi:hypothetical protein